MAKPNRARGERTPIHVEPPMFVTWQEGDERGRAQAFKVAAESLARAEARYGKARATDIYKNISPAGVSVRDGFTKADYDYFRPQEHTPLTQRMLINDCMMAYKRVGIVRNIVDLMADFAVQGLTIVHPNVRIQKFFEVWWKKVRGKDRTERILNLLYRAGNVIIRRRTAHLRPSDVERFFKGQAGDPNNFLPEPKLAPREVPSQYTIMNPLQMEVLGGEIAPFLGPQAFVYAIQIPPTLIKKIRNPVTETERKMINMLPAPIRQGIKDGMRLVPLESDKVRALYYKRDDWMVWADPMLSAVLDNLTLLKKMELADRSALDGAISQVRLWRLGSLEHRILPTEVAINRLADMLLNNVGGGVLDLVWGPELDLVETSTEVHRFLGETKYAPVLQAIYSGLGIPPTLTGSATASGFTNNYISLKTLIERLQYGRDVVSAFWEAELDLVQEAMGFRLPAKLRFDRMTLSDETAEKALLVQLIDRDLISPQTLQERFGEDPMIEEARIRQAERKRQNSQIPAKASPFHDPQQEAGLKKILAQSGALSASELGVALEDKKPGDKSPLDIQGDQTLKTAKIQAESQKEQNDHQYRTEKLQLQHGVHPAQLQQQATKTGVSGQGRPKNSKDSKKRKQKVVKPRSAAGFVEALAWAEEAQKAVAEMTAPAYLQALGKKNLRQLSAEEAKNFEDFKFAVLANLSPATPVSGPALAKITARELTIPGPMAQLLRTTLAKYAAKAATSPSADMLRRIQASVVALWHAEPPAGVTPAA